MLTPSTNWSAGNRDRQALVAHLSRGSNHFLATCSWMVGVLGIMKMSGVVLLRLASADRSAHLSGTWVFFLIGESECACSNSLISLSTQAAWLTYQSQYVTAVEETVRSPEEEQAVSPPAKAVRATAPPARSRSRRFMLVVGRLIGPTPFKLGYRRAGSNLLGSRATR